MTNHRIIRTFKNTILISLKDAKLLPKHRCELYQYFPVPASNLKEVHYKVKLGKVSWNMSPNLDGSHFLMRCICPYLFSFFFCIEVLCVCKWSSFRTTHISSRQIYTWLNTSMKILYLK